ncbi:hypothetical protein F4811DRAFT_551082 [Daldinia bambusicola]|nr:hypothetical protein F4811DRAFT_551082 [Daldinia bambusicola]
MSPATRSVALVGLMALFTNLGHAQSIPIVYCASLNTASTAANSSHFQSDGLCHDFCADTSAFAVVKYDQCWCSDYVPDESSQVDTEKCDMKCPGYPKDLCGGDGLWGYMSLDRQPSGTKSAGSASSTKTSSPDPTTKTLQNTVTVTPTVHATTAVPDTTSKSKSEDSTTTPAPTTPSVSTVTTGGTIKTVTIMPTITDSPDASPDASSNGMSANQHGLSTGAAVGIAIGVFAAVGLAVGAGLFFWLRQRRRDQGDALADSPGSQRGSSAGMMSTPTTGMASVWDGDNASGRRNSRFMPHDPRMDPFAANIYSRENKSQESINTLQDNHDYSRKVLRTTNPDPPEAD